MPRHVTIIQGHPDPAGGHLCNALADAYAEGAQTGGHGVSRIDLAKIDFPLLRTQVEFEAGNLPRSLAGARDALITADHVVIVFPLWLGTMPALVKAFLEQIMRPGATRAPQSDGLPRKPLAGRSARLVVTMGVPTFAYRLHFIGQGLSGFERKILYFLGLKPIRESFFGPATASDATRRGWIARMRELGKEAA